MKGGQRLRGTARDISPEELTIIAHPHQPAVARVREPVLRRLLPNGLAVVLCPREHLAQSYVAFYCGIGSRHESVELNGITHVLEHMLFRGTPSYPEATALNAAAENFGGFLEGATYRDHMMLATGCHPAAAGDAIDILAEIVQSPRYRGMAVELSILREELLETLDGDGRMVDLDNIAHRALFGSHPLALPIEGTLANIERFGVAEIEAHRKRFMVASNAVLSIAGPFDPDRIMRKLARAFGHLPTGNAPLLQAPLASQPEPLLRYVRDAASQVDVRVSFRGVPSHDPQYPALVMLVRLLADGLASRMHAALVDRRGLAYALHAGLTTYGDCGLFDFEFAVAPDRAAEALQGVLDFAAASARFRYSATERQRALRRYRYGIEFMRDSAADLASWYGRATLFGVERQMQTLGMRLARLSDAEIHQAARRVFRRQGMVVASAGELARGEWRRVQQVVAGWKGAS